MKLSKSVFNFYLGQNTREIQVFKRLITKLKITAILPPKSVDGGEKLISKSTQNKLSKKVLKFFLGQKSRKIWMFEKLGTKLWPGTNYRYRERERDKQKIWDQRIWVLWSILRHKKHKKHFLKHARFFRTRRKQYASAKLAVGIKTGFQIDLGWSKSLIKVLFYVWLIK